MSDTSSMLMSANLSPPPGTSSVLLRPRKILASILTDFLVGHAAALDETPPLGFFAVNAAKGSAEATAANSVATSLSLLNRSRMVCALRAACAADGKSRSSAGDGGACRWTGRLRAACIDFSVVPVIHSRFVGYKKGGQLACSNEIHV